MNRRLLLPIIIVVGLLSLTVIGFLVISGVRRPQQAVPSKAAANWSRFDYADSKITYHDNPACWKVVTGAGGTYRQADHQSPQKPYCQPIWTEWAGLSTTGTGVAFDQLAVGYAAWDYGDKVNVKVDGGDFAQFNTFANLAGPDRVTRKWTSQSFSCGEHSVELHPMQDPKNGALTLSLAYIEIHTCTPGGWTQIDDTDFRMAFNSPCWTVITSQNSCQDNVCYRPRGGSEHQTPNGNNCARDFSAVATLDLTGTSALNFDQFRIGGTQAPNRSVREVWVDGAKVGDYDSSAPAPRRDWQDYVPWMSPTLSCGPHKIEVKNGRPGPNGGLAFDVDFIDVHPCTPPSMTGFLTCQNNACSLSDTATATDSACLSKRAGDSCGGGTGGGGGGGGGGGDTTLNCQGNPHAPARCFDCHRDASGSSQINILDFACFAKFYGQSVGIGQ